MAVVQALEGVVIAGHFGFATGVKAKAKAVPLWALMLASQWLDVVFVPLVLAGVERFDHVPGASPNAYGAAIIYADYTHSLVGAIVLSALFGGLAALRYGRRGGEVLGLVAMSHWVLDVPMHRADMPILPGNLGGLPRLGFGLWRSPGASALLELVIVVVGAWMYWSAALEVAGGDPAVVRRARVCGVAVLASGLITLALNVAGM